jgi:hypothetical protein
MVVRWKAEIGIESLIFFWILIYAVGLRSDRWSVLPKV